RAFQALLHLPFFDRMGREHRPALDFVNHLALYNCRTQLELLDGTGVRCPPITSYLDRLIAFVEASFEKRGEAEAAAEDDPLDR
ncbi:MAG TPA: epimerase, partial [Anaeromyxobacteraceae bacterium]|nr:epimerase [Anaeromyxobacteraceae bacterium]